MISLGGLINQIINPSHTKSNEKGDNFLFSKSAKQNPPHIAGRGWLLVGELYRSYPHSQLRVNLSIPHIGLTTHGTLDFIIE